MIDQENIARVEFNGRCLDVAATEGNDGGLSFRILPSTNRATKSSLILSRPFRKVIDPERLALIVRTLLKHDFLLTKRLDKGSALEFALPVANNSVRNHFETLVSLNQEGAIAASPNEKVMPWLLPKADLKALYPFQKLGVDWLLTEHNRLLADDMGLGKTVQTVFAVRHGFSELLFRHVLILCPKSLVMNWLGEFQKWAPELLSVVIAPPSRTASKVWDKALGNSHVVISNYEQARDAKALANGVKFDLVVADEAHRLRNATSQVVHGFKAIERHRFWALTGTPIERDLKDLATLMSLLDEKRFSIADSKNASAALREKAKPYILRRTKAAVLKDLPEVVSQIELLELLDQQKRTYRSVQSGLSCEGEQIKNALHKLGELRRVCDFDPVSKTSVKLDRILEELKEVQALGEKAIVFSYVLEPLEALQQMSLKDVKGLFISGQMDGDERNQVIARFKSDPAITVLFASSKVASEGLTLVEANHVFFVNRWWNPSSNAQARDRVNRIGQVRTVFIHEYVCIGTVEEKIQKLLVDKGQIYENVVGKLEDLLLADPDVKAHLG